MTTRIKTKVALVVAALSLGGAGCAAATTSPEPSATAAASASASVLATAVATSGQPSMIVLADGIGSDQGLWRFQAPDQWVALGPAAGFTAIGAAPGGVALANQGSVEIRVVTSMTGPGTATQLRWPGGSPTMPVASIDRSSSASVALALSDGVNSSYAIAASDGAVTMLNAASRQSFSPIVAWLDDTRLAMLSTDDQQASRLAVLDVRAGTLTALKAIGGVRSFAVSGDRGTIVAATETALYAAPVGDWLAGTEPRRIVDLGADEVVWHLALNREGSGIAMLSGTEAADGTVSAVKEIGYVAGTGAWKQSFSSPVPFQTARGQAWVG